MVIDNFTKNTLSTWKILIVIKAPQTKTFLDREKTLYQEKLMNSLNQPITYTLVTTLAVQANKAVTDKNDYCGNGLISFSHNFITQRLLIY